MSCLFGHDWVASHTCANVLRTGSLPGEYCVSGNQNNWVYRYERWCRQCHETQYHAHLPGGPQWLPVPEGDRPWNGGANSMRIALDNLWEDSEQTLKLKEMLGGQFELPRKLRRVQGKRRLQSRV